MSNADLPGVEIESTYRVYTRQWLHVSRSASRDDAESLRAAMYEGRLPEDATRIVEDPDAMQGYVLQARLWTVWAEFKRRIDADAERDSLVEELGWDPATIEVVARNSREEHRLRQVGKVKMRSGT